MREWKVNVVNAPNRYVLIAAESALEAEVLARRDGYSTFGMTVLWSGEDEGNEFEGMTPRELRNAIRTLQEDLKRAVEDRRKLLTLVHGVAEDVKDGPLDYLARRIQRVINEVEGR